MKLLFDFFPIILFFIAFKLFNIYVATAVAMIASLAQVIGYRLKQQRFEFIHLITLVIILLLGGATILAHNPMFIKWKPTVVYWLLAVIFFISQFIGEKTLLQRMLANKIVLTAATWKRLNLIWITFFTAMGGINLYVAYHYPTNTWVNFKLFGILGLTIVFVLLQSIYLARHMESVEK